MLNKMWLAILLHLIVLTACGGPDTSIGGWAQASTSTTSETTEAHTSETGESTGTTDLADSSEGGMEATSLTPDLPKDECEFTCAGDLGPQQLFIDLNTTCEEWVQGAFCQKNEPLTRGTVAHLVYWTLALDQVAECTDFVPSTPYAEETDPNWYDKEKRAVRGLQCIGALTPEKDEKFCGLAPACQDWWQVLLKALGGFL